MELPDPFNHISASLPSTRHLRHTRLPSLVFALRGVQDTFSPDHAQLPAYNPSNTSHINLRRLVHVIDQNVPFPATGVRAQRVASCRGFALGSGSVAGGAVGDDFLSVILSFAVV